MTGITSQAAEKVLTNPLIGYFAITSHDSNNETENSRALYVGVSGDVVAVMIDGTAITFKNMAAGVWHPMVFKRINSTSTTATDMVGGY